MDSESSRSLVELIIVGLLSGAGGATLAALLRIRHERKELVRVRMLEAADDFGTGAIQAFIPLRRIEQLDRDDPDGQQAYGERVRRFGELLDEVVARLARLELLFGVGSPTATAANQFVGSLSEVRRELEEPDSDMNAVSRHGRSAADHLNAYTRAAGQAIGSARAREPRWGLTRRLHRGS